MATRFDPYRGWTKEYPFYVLRESIASAVRGAPDAWLPRSTAPRSASTHRR